MSTANLKAVVQWAATSAHDDSGEDCFHCKAVAAVRELEAIERAASQIQKGPSHGEFADGIRHMHAISKEAR